MSRGDIDVVDHQVGSRSSLSWEDSVRPDLSYAETRSIIGDVVILLRTVKASIAPGEVAMEVRWRPTPSPSPPVRAASRQPTVARARSRVWLGR